MESANANQNKENEYKLFKWLLTMKTLFILRIGWGAREIFSLDHPPCRIVPAVARFHVLRSTESWSIKWIRIQT